MERFEIFVSPVPSWFIVKICATPVRVLLKASFVPSGDQTGEKSKPVIVITFTFVPSLFVIQMLPSLPLKASRVPSGEQDGKLPTIAGSPTGPFSPPSAPL